VRKRLLHVFALALFVAAGGRTPSAADAAAPRRIISLVPAVTQMLFAIGGGARLVAVSNYDRDPPEVAHLARVGGLLDPDTERILALRPDLVIVYQAQHELEQRLTQAHIRYYEYAHKDLANVMATMRALGDVLGTRDAAERVARGIDAKLHAIAERVAGRPRPLVLLVISRDPQSLRNIYANGGYGFLHDMIEIAGGRDS
jgi:iron complex transport system substrate-binding protein